MNFMDEKKRKTYRIKKPKPFKWKEKLSNKFILAAIKKGRE